MTTAIQKMRDRADEAHTDLVGAISDHKAGFITDDDLAEIMEYSSVRQMALRIFECMEEAQADNFEKWWRLL